MRNILLSFFLVAFIIVPFSGNAQTMQDYTSNPVFTTTDVVPNVLFLVDSSGSMLCNAYPDPPGGDDSSDSVIDEGYDPNNKYYGENN